MEKLLNKIEFEIISDEKRFKEMRGSWNALLEESGINNPFLRHEWLSAWWEAYGADKKLMVIEFKRNGKTIGFAPCMKYKTQLTGLNVDVLGFLTNHWTRMDFILAEENHSCLEAFVHWIKENGLTVILAQVDTSSKNYSALIQILKENKIKFVLTPKLNTFISLNGTWDDYMKNQSRNFRQDFRKKLRRFEKNGAVSLDTFGADDPSVVEKLKQIAQNSWQSKENVNLITTSQGDNFYKEILKAWKDTGKVDISILQLAAEPVAYMVGIKNHDCYFAFDTAYSKKYQEYSPGVLMHNLLLERLFNEKCKCFDFGYVAEYKKRWTEESLATQDITIFLGKLLGKGLSLMHHLKKFARK